MSLIGNSTMREDATMLLLLHYDTNNEYVNAYFHE